MIEFRGVNKTFYLGDSAVRALDAIDLQIDQGDYLSVMTDNLERIRQTTADDETVD